MNTIESHILSLRVINAALRPKTPNPKVIRAAMRCVADPIAHLAGREADQFAALVARDSNGALQVLRDRSGALVSRYTKEFAQEEFRVDPPHLFADQTGKMLVAKKVSPEQFILWQDEGPVPLHPANEISGSLLMSALGAPSYDSMTRGREYEYFGYLPGIDLASAKENGLLAEIESKPELRQKLLFSVGIALAQAYIIGARDRFGGIRFNLALLESAKIDEVKTGQKVVCQNIDLSSALDQRVFDRGLVNFWNAFSLYAPVSFRKQESIYGLNSSILQGFLSGYRLVQDHFRLNQGRSSDLIRSNAGKKADLIFANLQLPPAELEAATVRYQSEK
ncbi:MAG: hypothetical protein KKF06_00605 [Candidatus Margulisbacteria bacterium]|nr:hypothetical protein [Candidatus Margulisiibacteriota bacterium]